MGTKNKKVKSSVVSDTTSIQLNVPNELYYKVKHKADKDTLADGEKKTIHDRMIEDIAAQNK